jgi:hypothetical protein
MPTEEGCGRGKSINFYCEWEKILFRSLALLVSEWKSEILGECVIIEIHTSNIECERPFHSVHISSEATPSFEHISSFNDNMGRVSRIREAQRMIKQSHRKLFTATLKAIR